MAEEHGMYKGLAPGERERGVKNNGVLLHWFVSAVTAKSWIV